MNHLHLRLHTETRWQRFKRIILRRPKVLPMEGWWSIGLDPAGDGTYTNTSTVTWPSAGREIITHVALWDASAPGEDNPPLWTGTIEEFLGQPEVRDEDGA